MLRQHLAQHLDRVAVAEGGGQRFLPGACNNPRQRALSRELVEDQMFATLLLITLCMTVYAFAMVAGDEG